MSTCTNCYGRGMRDVRDSDGERGTDPCYECDAWSRSIALTRRSQAAADKLRAAGFSAATARGDVVVGDHASWTIRLVPTATGGWLASFTRGDDARALAAVMAIVDPPASLEEQLRASLLVCGRLAS